jgi:E3 ubiquitin-protein ligase HUWE1
MYDAVKKQIDAFKQGFNSVLPTELLGIFDNKELELLISGLPTIDVDDLMQNTNFEGYTMRSKPVIFLFNVLKEFT